MSRKKLIFHVGLPKTGTSALQRWCASNRAQLRCHNINYPHTEPHLISPKHQFLVPSLMNNDLEKLRIIITQNSENTLLLSTEGLTNHLYDFLPDALSTLREMTNDFDVIIFMVSREENSWTKSFYKQAVLNPFIMEYHYATALKYSEFCHLPRVQRLINTSALREELKVAFGAHTVVITPYEGNWMSTFLEVLGVPDLKEMSALTQNHISVSDDLIDLIRQLNAMQLPTSERVHFLAAIQACFQTNNNMLKFSYKVPIETNLRSHKNMQILEQLIPETAEQSEIISNLSKWLMDSQGPYFSFCKFIKTKLL